MSGNSHTSARNEVLDCNVVPLVVFLGEELVNNFASLLKYKLQMLGWNKWKSAALYTLSI